MTTRTDVTYDLVRSPRIAEVAAPSIEMLMQDYVDTTRPFESSFEAMSHTFLMDASGKQDLGGGEFVTVTVEERDLKLSFEARTTAAETGTVTTGSSTPIRGEITFTDTAATFIANGVARGSLVINFTDQSVADVVSVDAEDTLTTKTLVNGIGNTFDVADVYHVFNIIQCTSTGGNLVATDSNDVTFPAILPTAFTQIIQTKASSGTITNLDTITAQVADIHGQVRRSIFVDTTALTNGDGYQQTPYNNFTDAVDDAEANDLSRLVILADATVDRQMKNFIFEGVGSPALDINGQDVGQSEFIGIEIDGTIGGVQPIHAEDCIIRDNVTGLNGRFEFCGFGGDLSLLPANITIMVDCYSAIGGLGRPTIDTGGSGTNVSIRSFRGGLTVTGTDDVSDAVTVSMSQGKLTLDATNTAGNISVRGIAQFTDNSAGSTVDITGLLNQELVAGAVWNALVVTYTAAGSFGQIVGKKLMRVADFFGLRT